MRSAVTPTGTVRAGVAAIPVMSTTRIHAQKKFFKNYSPIRGEKNFGGKNHHRGTV